MKVKHNYSVDEFDDAETARKECEGEGLKFSSVSKTPDGKFKYMYLTDSSTAPKADESKPDEPKPDEPKPDSSKPVGKKAASKKDESEPS